MSENGRAALCQAYNSAMWPHDSAVYSVIAAFVVITAVQASLYLKHYKKNKGTYENEEEENAARHLNNLSVAGIVISVLAVLVSLGFAWNKKVICGKYQSV